MFTHTGHVGHIYCFTRQFEDLSKCRLSSRKIRAVSPLILEWTDAKTIVIPLLAVHVLPAGNTQDFSFLASP